MKLKIDKQKDCEEVEIIVRCNEIDQQLESLIEHIQSYCITILHKKNDLVFHLSADVIFYFESIDEKTFTYTKNEVYDCELKLYELEEKLKQTSYCRVSKSCILNTSVVAHVRPLIGGRLEATLDNEEKVIVNRHYLPMFKMKFGLEVNV